jgi:hypothetical protein
MTDAASPPLFSSVYTSVATAPLDDAGLSDILTASRKNNSKVDVTGILLHRDGRFIQFLEGPEAAVRTVLARIEADPRHDKVRVLLEDTIATRQFAEWTMGYQPAGEAGGSMPEGFRRSFDDLETGDDRILMVQAARDLTQWFRTRAQPTG